MITPFDSFVFFFAAVDRRAFRDGPRLLWVKEEQEVFDTAHVVLFQLEYDDFVLAFADFCFFWSVASYGPPVDSTLFFFVKKIGYDVPLVQ